METKTFFCRNLLELNFWNFKLGIGNLIIVFLDFPPQQFYDQEKVRLKSDAFKGLKLSLHTILGSNAIRNL